MIEHRSTASSRHNTHPGLRTAKIIVPRLESRRESSGTYGTLAETRPWVTGRTRTAARSRLATTADDAANASARVARAMEIRRQLPRTRPLVLLFKMPK
eukprot:scaffold461_cov131-Isochrysis_galbana.AAC.3